MTVVHPTRGYADVLVGLQYGDEGKAKIIDLLAPDYDIVARFNGGANAGHTIDTPQGRVVLQQVPCAIFQPGTLLYIGSGCAVNLWKLVAELDQIAAHGVDLTGRLHVSDRAAVVQPVHLIVDERNSAGIGTTKNGMGPCYADRAYRMRGGARTNLQLRDVLADPAGTVAAMRAAAEAELAASGGDTAAAHRDLEERLTSFAACVERVRGYVQPRRTWLAEQVGAGARVLFEGAQSMMLDVVHGDQPYVTASHTVPAYAYVGGDLPPRFHRYTIGVAKAVMSRVGNGPFPSELGAERSAAYFAQAVSTGRGRAEEHAEFDVQLLRASTDELELGIAMRMLTHEYGSGTGRPRRIGILDLEQLREMVVAVGVDVVYLNKVDCLSLYGETMFNGIPVRVPATAEHGATRVLPSFSAAQLDAARPDELPLELLEFRSFVEREIGVPVIGFGMGPQRDQITQFFRLGEYAH
ncbi:adenylosuccinate synthetase [Catellatospora sp. TT07R-123]|uniref:adenylosuccinate synthetase n=1 Tax=Catellatospora sp. TT07R-123 TaxID=2733863 RepID=UPI001B07BAA5|nr:adenylosuccinate synthetase [Catellatospora sp. TT07R-123]GHJ49373.1 adenylosuccinate synthetase [Catellatospora sp. TT07R-123]